MDRQNQGKVIMSEQQTVEDRIANIFGVGDSGEPESAPQPQADEQTASEAPEAAQEADAQQGDDAKQPSEGDYFELTGDDGQTYQVPIALKSLQEASKDRKSTRLNSSHQKISYAVFCLKK